MKCEMCNTSTESAVAWWPGLWFFTLGGFAASAYLVPPQTESLLNCISNALRWTVATVSCRESHTEESINCKWTSATVVTQCTVCDASGCSWGQHSHIIFLWVHSYFWSPWIIVGTQGHEGKLRIKPGIDPIKNYYSGPSRPTWHHLTHPNDQYTSINLLDTTY